MDIDSFDQKTSGNIRMCCWGLVFAFENQKKNSKNSVHKGAGYIGWLAGEKFLSTEISKFVNVEFQKMSAKVANSKCEKNIREHHNELQEACVCKC